MSEVDPRLKDNVGTCGCGCGLEGTLKRPWRDGSRCVARRCRCVRCRNKNNSHRGKRKQTAAVTAIGIPRTSADEENLGGLVRVEVKSGKQVRPVFTRYLAAEAQSEASRSFGDHRPFAALFMPEGTKDGLAVVRLSVLHEFCAAIVEQWGGAA